MSVVNEKLSVAFKQIGHEKTFWIAYSGGIDSIVLLHAAKHLAEISGHTLKAIHINHQIHIDSDRWTEFCELQCRQLAVTLTTLTVDIGPTSELGMEGAARVARYQAFENCLGENDVLLTAHHADDQVETVLLQLFRGAGVQGLTGCSAQRALGQATVIRPLLAVSRKQITEYAQQHNLNWLDDPSNASLQHDRNYLRHQLLPLLYQRWPGLRETIARSSQWQIESARLLERLANIDSGADNELTNPMPIKVLKGLDESAIKNVLRWWIRKLDYPMPSARILKHIVSDVVFSAKDSEACVKWLHCECRKYRDHIYLQAQLSPHDNLQTFEWEIKSPLFIASLNLELTRDKLEGFGLNCDQMDVLQVKFRQGGERFRPKGRGCQKDLKTLFQEAAVEPWLRDRIPLIYDRDTLILVWGYWIDEGH
ncbi:MAG: tRNA lysidine(34) synthetase TilS [Pseudomonadota bacterium]